MKTHITWPSPLKTILAISITIGLNFLQIACNVQKQPPQSNENKNIERPQPTEVKKLENLDDARKLAVDTWTCSPPGDIWIKLVITKDGRFVEYDAHPTNDNWGRPAGKGRWKVRTGKYSDTGKRYYSITFSSEDYPITSMLDDAVLVNTDQIYFPVGNAKGYLLQRGDNFPFSK